MNATYQDHCQDQLQNTKKPVVLTNATGFVVYGAGTKSRTRDPLITSPHFITLINSGSF